MIVLLVGLMCRTTVVNKYDSDFDVYIGRGSKWGNEYTHLKDKKTKAKFVVASRGEAIAAYREWITDGDGKHLLDDLHELRGKRLGCTCKPRACHGDVLVSLIQDKFEEGVSFE